MVVILGKNWKKTYFFCRGMYWIFILVLSFFSPPLFAKNDEKSSLFSQVPWEGCIKEPYRVGQIKKHRRFALSSLLQVFDLVLLGVIWSTKAQAFKWGAGEPNWSTEKRESSNWMCCRFVWPRWLFSKAKRDLPIFQRLGWLSESIFFNQTFRAC